MDILEDDLDEYKQSLFYNKNVLGKLKENSQAEPDHVDLAIKKAESKIKEIELLLKQLEEKKDINCCLEYLNERSLEKIGTKSYLDQDNKGADEDYMPNFDGEEDEYPYENELSWKAYDHISFEIFPKVTSTILEGFKEYGKREDADILIKYIEKNFFSYTHTKELSESFQKIDINYSAAKLLEMVKDEHTGELRKKVATNILHRLEFGKIGISEEGVKYLERIYDLGEYNNPDYHARRLTVDGEIGIFDAEKALIKFIKLFYMSNEVKKIKAKVLDFAYDTLFVGQENETGEEKKKRLEYLEEFKKNYYKIAQDEIFKKTDVQLNNLSFKELGWFLIYINELNKKEDSGEEKERLKKFVKEFGEEGIKTFLAMEHGEDKGRKIIELSKLPEAKNIFKSFSSLADKGQRDSENISQELSKNYPDIEFSEGKIAASMIARGKDLLDEAHGCMINGDHEKIRRILHDLKNETSVQNILREKFSAVAEMLEQDEVDLNRFNEANLVALRGLEDQKNKVVFLRALGALEKLKPLPEIFWKVNRNLEEYGERFGFDVEEFLNDFSDPDTKKTLLEFGPGSGVSKQQRAASEVGQKYNDFAMSDNLYYSLGKTIESLIDYNKIEQQIGKLEIEDREKIADYIYKTIMIKKGETGNDKFKYDQKNIEAITDDPNNIKEILANLGDKLRSSEMVPTDYQTTAENGELIYPRKIEIDKQSKSFQESMNLIKKDITQYLRSDLAEYDVYEAIPAYPGGVLVGDFRDIEKFKKDQIDVALGVRSTVYLEGEDYQKFLYNISDKLTDGGIYIDDNIRDNFGRNYRIADLLKFKQGIEARKASGEINHDLNIKVITGHGVSGEDFNQENVPLALVMSKNTEYKNMLEKKLSTGYSLHDLEDLSNSEDYLKNLDKDGNILKQVQKIRQVTKVA